MDILKPQKSSHVITGWLIIRGMSVIYGIAFASLGVQVLGLIGHDGILPVGTLLQVVTEHLGRERFWVLPTLCWFNASDAFLLFLCWGGVVLSILLFVGLMPGLTAVLLWMFYLSLVTVGQEFFGFQWDSLLLESGFLLIFFVSWKKWFKFFIDDNPSFIILWLFRWLAFRLVFESGLVKLMSGDPTWRNLTALTYHYWTQPLPNAISWYAAQLPVWFHKVSVVIMMMTELVFPLFIFSGRWGRMAAFWGIVGLQLIIILTGNYCFFNLLTIVICFSLLDDAFWIRFIPMGWRNFFQTKEIKHGWVSLVVPSVVVVLIGIITLTQFSIRFTHRKPLAPIAFLMNTVEAFRSINHYGLFAVMTTSRMEIIIEGSNDGQNWLPYEFKWKPGDLKVAPKWVMPHQPRLDWQMWFAALGSFRQDPWIINFQQRLLEGSKPVLNLLANNPFPVYPPKYIRAIGYDYQFTNFPEREADGHWWKRTPKGLYSPILTLR